MNQSEEADQTITDARDAAIELVRSLTAFNDAVDGWEFLRTHPDAIVKYAHAGTVGGDWEKVVQKWDALQTCIEDRTPIVSEGWTSPRMVCAQTRA